MAEQKTIYKTYKYRLYPNKKQEAIFNEWLETCRRLYNYFIQQRMDRWEKIKDLPKEERKYISFFDQLKHLTQIKKENKYLQRVYAHVLQDVASRVNSTYKRFYQARKKGTKLGGLPKFKQRKEYNSFKYNEYQNGKRFRIIGNKIFLGKVGLVKIIIDRPLPDNISIRTCVVKRDCTNWYACITFSFTKVYEEKILNKSKAIGLDMGIKSYGALSNGEKIENPKWINRHEKKLAHEQRLLSRKIKGSSNWKKQCIKLAKIYQKIRFQRKDFIHKQTTLLVKAYDIIALEDLQITNIMRNRYLAKSINEVSWGMFREFLKYKTEDSGKKLVIVSPYNTTQNCSCCGEKVEKNLKVRIHNCPRCGIILDRDMNASINILKRGLASLRSSNDNTDGLAECACGETSLEAQGSKKIVNINN